jgi:RHS repeat-associated protein
VTDQSGNVVARHDFLPFGEEITGGTAGRDSSWGSTIDVTQKFTGQVRDQETGLDFFNARYFAAALGRFTSVDPANAGANMYNPQSWNGYGYVNGNPLAFVDPSGECTKDGKDAEGNFCFSSGTPPNVNPTPPKFNGTPEDAYQLGWISGFFGPVFSGMYGGYASSSHGSGVGAGSGQSQNQQTQNQAVPQNSVTSASQAPGALLSKINNLLRPCSSILASRSTLRTKASQLSFWDARVNGSVPVSMVPGAVPVPSGATIGSSIGGANAVTLWGPNYSISPNVVLGTGFFMKNYPAQQTILLHELLHYTLQKNDQQVDQKYNILPGLFDSFSSAFNNWLTNNCHGG